MADMSPGRMSAAGGRGVSGGGGGALAGAGSPLTGEASSSSQIAPQAQRVCRFCSGHGGQRRQGRTGGRIRHQQHAAAIGQDVPKLHAAGRRIDGHHHRAQPTAAQDDGQEFVPVAGHQPDTVATPDTCRGQARGPACGVGRRIAEAQGPTRRLHPQAIAQTGALLHQQRRQCQRMHGDASPIVRPLPGVARLYGISLGINYLCVKIYRYYLSYKSD